ncbi:hypothetical protein H4Q26_012925 [Puccinia striiformis f. sp. tritici PST-130]|nr:hypothetical protein H4Q26_012925 [Puccinia striiformis f. sp. tritici PST-130]
MIDSSLDFLATELNESTRVAPASNKDGPRPDRDTDMVMPEPPNTVVKKLKAKKDNDTKHKQNRVHQKRQ